MFYQWVLKLQNSKTCYYSIAQLGLGWVFKVGLPQKKPTGYQNTESR